jgi:hypothetical protein
MPNVTVTGVSGTIVTVPFTGTANYNLAQQLALLINNAATAGNLNAFYPGLQTTAGGVTEEVVTVSGAVTPTAGTNFLTDSLAGAVTVQGSSFLNVIAGTGGLTFYGAAGFSSIAAGGGSNLISMGPGTSYYAAVGGSDTVYANGTGTVDAGSAPGPNLIFTSQYSVDANVVYSGGTGDTIIAGAGATTIGETGSGAMIYLGTGSVDLLGAGTNDTISGSTVSGTAATIYGGSKDLIFGNAESISYIASVGGFASIFGTGNDAIVGALNTSLTLGTGADTLEYFKGATPATDVVTGFTASDTLDTFGYGGSPTVTSVSGSTTVTLADGTKITLSGFTPASTFLKST